MPGPPKHLLLEQHAKLIQPPQASQTFSGSGSVFSTSLIDGDECPLSIPQPASNDKTSFHLLAYEYVEYYVKPNRELPREVVRILKKDVLPYWGTRDARTITSREIIERLDTIVARGAP